MLKAAIMNNNCTLKNHLLAYPNQKQVLINQFIYIIVQILTISTYNRPWLSAIKFMSNYYPRTMNKWKVHKRTNDSSLNHSVNHHSQGKQTSTVLHSLCGSMHSLSSRRPQNTQRTEKQVLKSDAKGQNSGKEHRISHAMLFNCRGRSNEQKQITKSAIFGRHSSYSYRKKSQRKEEKDHKQRKMQTLQSMEQLGLDKILVVSSQRIPQTKQEIRCQHHSIEELKELQVSYITEVKEVESRVDMWCKQSQQMQAEKEQQNQIRNTNQKKIKQEKNDEEKFFLSVHQSHLHWRNNNQLKQSKRQRKVSHFDPTWEGLQQRRRKRLAKLHNSRNSTMRLGPWQAPQFSI